MQQEKEDPDDVIYDGDVIRITTPYSEFIQFKDFYEQQIEKSYQELQDYLYSSNKRNKNLIDLYTFKISIFSKLYFIAVNAEDYKNQINKAYQDMCDLSKAKDINDYKKINKSLTKIIEKGRQN